jgi:hypothetical protein
MACMAVGTVGFAGMAVSSAGWVFGLCAIVATSFGWGYAALFFLRVIELAGGGRSAGVVVSVGSMTGAVSPMLFGLLAGQSGYRTCWLVAAAVMGWRVR